MTSKDRRNLVKGLAVVLVLTAIAIAAFLGVLYIGGWLAHVLWNITYSGWNSQH